MDLHATEPPPHFFQPQPLLRRLLIWSFVCVVSAGPSFFWGAGLFQRPSEIIAMVTGVAMFITAYTWVTGHQPFVRLSQNPSARLALKIAYLTRIGLSIVFPISLLVDMFCGMVAVLITGIEPERPEPFEMILLTTLVQGVILNVLLFLFAAMMYGLIRAFGGGTRPPAGICLECGYDLRATPERCPECGLEVRV